MAVFLVKFTFDDRVGVAHLLTMYYAGRKVAKNTMLSALCTMSKRPNKTEKGENLESATGNYVNKGTDQTTKTVGLGSMSPFSF